MQIKVKRWVIGSLGVSGFRLTATDGAAHMKRTRTRGWRAAGGSENRLRQWPTANQLHVAVSRTGH
jgi:hypothetical protein